jgi:hypothetical protein
MNFERRLESCSTAALGCEFLKKNEIRKYDYRRNLCLLAFLCGIGGGDWESGLALFHALPFCT